VIWGKKRQEDDAVPTSSPELPEDDDDDDDFPPPSQPTQPNSVGLNPPTYTVIWGKEKRVAAPAPEPTAAPAVAERDAEAEPKPTEQYWLRVPLAEYYVAEASAANIYFMGEEGG
jgi:hypothetical protein